MLKHGEKMKLGNLTITSLMTPCHTRGSICYFVEGDPTQSPLLFTGDTLFINGIGRPDLRDNAKEFASMLYDTLHNKLFSLSKDVLVFPAHFDKDVQSQKIISSSLGEIEKKGIGFLKLDRQSFIDKISSMVIPMPSNFKEIIAINSGNKPSPTVDELFDLEIGPNRCNISM